MTEKLTPAHIFILALLLRLCVLLATFPGSERVTYFDDGKIALNLIEGRGYSIDFGYRNWLFYEAFLKDGHLESPITDGVKPTASKQPLYPLVLALIFACCGTKNFLAVFILQALLSSLMCAILMIGFQRISRLTSIILGVGTAVYPSFVVHAVTTPESTTLLLFLISLYFLSLFRLCDANSTSRWFVTGFWGALLVMTEPVTLPFVVLCLAYVGYLSLLRHVDKAILGVLVASAVLVMVQLPWLARNFVVFHRFPVVKSIPGNVFNWGLEYSGRGTWLSDEKLISLEHAGRYKSEIEEDEAIRREIAILFPSHWKEYVAVDVPRNILHFWWEVRRYSHERSLRYLLGRRIPYVVLLLLALPSLFGLGWRLRARSVDVFRECLPEVCALILMITYTAVYAVFGAYMSRYRFPVELALFVFFGETVANVLKRTRWGSQSMAVRG